MKQPAAPLTRRQRVRALYLAILARIDAEAKQNTDNAQQGAEPAATAAR